MNRNEARKLIGQYQAGNCNGAVEKKEFDSLCLGYVDSVEKAVSATNAYRHLDSEERKDIRQNICCAVLNVLKNLSLKKVDDIDAYVVSSAKKMAFKGMIPATAYYQKKFSDVSSVKENYYMEFGRIPSLEKQVEILTGVKKGSSDFEHKLRLLKKVYEKQNLFYNESLNRKVSEEDDDYVEYGDMICGPYETPEESFFNKVDRENYSKAVDSLSENEKEYYCLSLEVLGGSTTFKQLAKKRDEGYEQLKYRCKRARRRVRALMEEV